MLSLLLVECLMDTFSRTSQRKAGVAEMGETHLKMPSSSQILSDDLVLSLHIQGGNHPFSEG